MRIITHRTTEEIADLAEHLDGRMNIAFINKLFRDQDESDLFPIRGRFHVTNRAIDRVRRMTQKSGAVYGYEYAYALEDEIGRIVNDEKNW